MCLYASVAILSPKLQAEQLRVHEEKEEEMRLRLEELMKSAPSLKARGHVVQDFFYKQRYIYQEVSNV